MSTWWACSSTDMLRCSTPTPPCLAIATAMFASVTVSIAEDSNGTRSLIRRVSLPVVSASLGSSSECAGSSSTSSKVRAGGPNLASSVMSLRDAGGRLSVHPSDGRPAGRRSALRGGAAACCGGLECRRDLAGEGGGSSPGSPFWQPRLLLVERAPDQRRRTSAALQCRQPAG